MIVGANEHEFFVCKDRNSLNTGIMSITKKRPTLNAPASLSRRI